MTRKEFEECLKITINNCLVFKYKDEEYICPFNIDLRSFRGNGKCKCENEICRECWKESVKNIKFKGEEDMKRDLDKEYSIQEVFEFEEGTIFVGDCGPYYRKFRVRNGELEQEYNDNVWRKCEYTLKNILTLKLKLVEKQTEVSIKEAMEAYHIGKKIVCRYKTFDLRTEYKKEYKAETRSKSGKYLWDIEKYSILPVMILTGKWYVVEE